MASRSLHLPVLIDIPEPCSEDWNELSGDERARHCKRCSKDVHSLSALTEAQIVELVARDNVCISLEIDREGSLVSAEPKARAPGRASRVLLTAALTALAACGHRAGGSPIPAGADSGGGVRLGTTEAREATPTASNSASVPPVEIAPPVIATAPVPSAPQRLGGTVRPVKPPPLPPRHTMGKPMMRETPETAGY